MSGRAGIDRFGLLLCAAALAVGLGFFFSHGGFSNLTNSFSGPTHTTGRSARSAPAHPARGRSATRTSHAAAPGRRGSATRTSHAAAPGRGERHRGRSTRRTAPAKSSARSRRSAKARHAKATPGTLTLILRAAERILILLATLAGASMITRSFARARRRYVRLWLLPFRADEAEPEQVRRLMESWHQQLLQRWYRRLFLGQPGIALEVVMAADTEGDRAARLSIVCPENMIDGIEGALLACYSDTRLLRGGQALPPVKRVIRLRKRHLFVMALRTTADVEQRNTMDAVLTQMSSIQDTAILQYALTPTPALFDNYARRRFRSLEHRAESRRQWDPASPGLRSEVFSAEMQGGLNIQHHPLFFADVRVAATTLAGCRAIAGAVRGASGAENRLVERTLRMWALGGLCLRRMQQGIGNPLPDYKREVMSSSEVAALWQLPSPGLKVVRVARSPLPRIVAPPEISRDPAYALARDENGPVGIRPEDKSDGLGLIGGQKTGKTSLLCRTVQADATDPKAAMVVLMPKSGDAIKALSMVPENRTVHFLDLEHPEIGFNPLIGDGDPAMIADRVVESFRDVHAEGDIRGSSDRYLRQAAQAAVGAARAGVIDGPPNLWHMYRMLLPNEVSFRERVVESLYTDPRFADTATFFGRELPGDLETSASQTTAKLDAPRNKLLRLMVESLDRVLRHPIQISFDDIVRNREVLIVDGKMGTFGADNCRVMMQFLLLGLYGALQRQQQLPEEQRVRVAVKVDEAHLILNESFANAMATLRSGGLEMVAAWQYGEQIQDEKVRGGMMSLLRQRCVFSMGESTDARDVSSIAMSAYADMVRPDPESRARLRVTPDMIFNLPNHHAVCSWISRGARQPAFILQTIPLAENESAIAHHLQAQRDRGGHVPTQLPDPLPDFEWQGVRSPAGAELAAVGAGVAVDAGAGVDAAPLSVDTAPRPTDTAPATVAPAPTGSHDTTPSVLDAAAAIVDEAPAPAPSPVPDAPGPPPAPEVAAAEERAPIAVPDAPRPSDSSVPDSYAELDLDDVRGLTWEKPRPLPENRNPEPTPRDLEVLGALWTYRLLFANQIWRRWWKGSSSRAAQQGLKRMAEAGWVKRFKFQLAERGAQQRVYCLTKEGFELARGKHGRAGGYIKDDETWREPQITDPRRVLRDLHVNGWVLAFERVAGRAMGSWRGPRDSRLDPPRRKNRGEWIDLRPADIVLGTNHRLQGAKCERLESVTPDALIELRLTTGGDRQRLDLMIELDRGRGTGVRQERLARYDVFVSGWGRLHRRYREHGMPPVVVFVCEDERELLELLSVADQTLTTRIAKAGTSETDWPYPGRLGILFAVERDIHEGSVRAIALPEHPPELRVRLHGPEGKTCRPRRVHIVDPQLLGTARAS